MGTVTFVCVGCGLLAQSERRHAITCSVACRVRSHRNGSAKALRVVAATQRIEAGLVCQAHALQTLRPDLAQAAMAGNLEIDDAQPAVNLAFVNMVFRALGIEQAGALQVKPTATGAQQ